MITNGDGVDEDLLFIKKDDFEELEHEQEQEEEKPNGKTSYYKKRIQKKENSLIKKVLKKERLNNIFSIKFTVNNEINVIISNIIQEVILQKKSTKKKYTLSLKRLSRELLVRGFLNQKNTKKFARLVLRKKHPFNTSQSIFSSGKIMISSKNPRIADINLRILLSTMKKCGYTDFEIKSKETHNIVATGTTNYKICLNILAKNLPSSQTQYSERFPGVVIKSPKIEPSKLLVFKEGKYVEIGAKTMDHVINAFEFLVSMLEKYKENPKSIIIDKKLEVKRLKNEIIQEKSKEDIKNKKTQDYIKKITNKHNTAIKQLSTLCIDYLEKNNHSIESKEFINSI